LNSLIGTHHDDRHEHTKFEIEQFTPPPNIKMSQRRAKHLGIQNSKLPIQNSKAFEILIKQAVPDY
jgi:hypothetical protein